MRVEISNIRQKDDTEWLNNGMSLKFSHQWKNASYSQWLLSKSTYNSNHDLMTESVSVLTDTTFVYKVIGEDQNVIEDMTLHFNHEWRLNNHKLESGLLLSKYSTDYDANFNNSLTTFHIGKKVDGQVLAIYIQDKFNVIPRVTLTSGLRVSNYSIDKQWVLLPRISLRYELTPKSNVKSAWGRHIQYLHRFSNDFISSGSKFVWLLSADSLKPVNAEQFVIGYQHFFTNYDLNIEYYYNAKSNIANFSRLHHYPNYLFPADAYTSGLLMLGEETSQGFEILLNKFGGKINGWLSYNYGIAEWLFADINDKKPFPTNHDRTHDFKMVTMTHFGPWQFTLSWLYFSGRAFTDDNNLVIYEDENGNVALEAKPGTVNSSRLPNSHRLDVSIVRNSTWVGLKWEYGLSLFNVYNNKYISHKRYTFSSQEADILVNDIEIMGITPTVFLKISR